MIACIEKIILKFLFKKGTIIMANVELTKREIIKCLDDRKMKYGVSGNAITLSLKIEGNLQECKEVILIDEGGIIFAVGCPLKATKEVYNNVVEYLTRANFGMKIGAFQFDYTSGEIRFNSYLYVSTDIPSSEDIVRYIFIGFYVMQRYGGGLVKSLMGFGEPEKDIAELEK